MFPSEIEVPQQSITRNLLRGSVLWLAVGLVSGLLLALVKRYPTLLQECGFFPAGRVQLYHGGLLLFGWAFPMLFGLWTMRLRQMRKEPLRFIPLWEGATQVWYAALLWGVASAFFGQHSTWPTWIWMPVIYGSLFFAGLLFLVAVIANKPKQTTPHELLSFQCLVVGLGALLLLLLMFLLSPTFLRTRLPALTHTLIALGLLLPLLGLVLPTAQQENYTTALSPLPVNLFFWVSLFLFPLSSSVLSAQMGGALLWGIFQIALLVFTLLLLSPLTQAWKLSNAVHHPFWRAGALCLLLAAIEGTSFGVLRVLGNNPSPMWYSNHSHILLAGCILLWLQGSTYQLFASNNVLPVNLHRQSRWIILGLLMMLFGGWLEASLHLHLDQLALSRGILFPSGARTLRLVGGLIMIVPLLQFISHLWNLTEKSQKI